MDGSELPHLVFRWQSVWSFWHGGRKMERAAYLVGALLLVSGLIHLAILTIGGRTLMGPLSLRKPTTFGLSFGLTLITIAWVSSFLRLGDRARVILLGMFTVACVIETALVSLQAWRGVPSHYNMETTFDGLVTRTLAAGGITLVVIIAALTLAAFRANPMMSASLRIAIRIGFVALFSALIVGALMIAKGMVLVFAGDPPAAYATGGTPCTPFWCSRYWPGCCHELLGTSGASCGSYSLPPLATRCSPGWSRWGILPAWS